MEQQKFSVAMCVYGGDNAKYFDEALNSVFSQTRMPNEVVLAVDGPISSELETVIDSYIERYDFFKIYRLESNMGHGIARNLSLSKCSFPYVAIADADDINALDRFEKQMDILEQDSSISAISSACYHFVEDISNITNTEFLPIDDQEIKEYMKRRCPLCQASAILKRSDVEKAGGYQDWYHAEDYYLWIRMFLNGARFANSKEPLLYVRSNDSQMKRRGGLQYFHSLQRLYLFMYRHRVINLSEYIINVVSRFIIQVLMPTALRKIIRKKML